jgi:putative membrane protein
MDYLVRYGHFLGFMLLFASMVAGHLLIAPRLDGRQLRKLAMLDLIAGISVVLLIASGLAMLGGLGFGKGATYYLKNGVFHAKLTVFVVVLLLSIKPTVFFLRHRSLPPGASVDVPRSIVMLQRLQLVLVLLIPLLAILMARGVGARGG